MHEDIYFSILEYFQHYSGREPGNRGLQPGQIIPDIRLDNQDSPKVRVTLAPATPAQLAAPPLMTVDKKHLAEGSVRSDEQQAELQSLMRNSYAVFCLNTKKRRSHIHDKSISVNHH